jgi:HEPN domain-containing protein
MKEEDFLKERAHRFFQEAQDDIKKGFYDLAVFHLEQALQLKIKYLLAKKIGYFSKTHLISQLINEASRIFQNIMDFFSNFKEEIEDLELAYIGAKYLPISYSKEKAERLLNFVKKAFDFLEKYESN